MKKKLLIIVTFLLLLFSPALAGTKKATVFSPITGHRKVVTVGDPFAFAGDKYSPGGYMLETSYNYILQTPDQLGYSVVSNYKTTLSRSITSDAATVYVSSLLTKDSHTLTMTDLGNKVFLTIEPGGNKEEIIMCTGIGTGSFTGCTRGLAFYATSTAAVSANQKTHSAGASIIMSNVHYVYEQLVDNTDAETIAGNKTFTGNTTFSATTTNMGITIGSTTLSGVTQITGLDLLQTANTQAASKYYVDSVGAGGFTAGNASTTQGLQVFGTVPETVGIKASSTGGIAIDGSNGIYIKASSTGGIASDANGAYIDGSSSLTFSGSNVFSATTTFNGYVYLNASTTYSTYLGAVPSNNWRASSSAQVSVVAGGPTKKKEVVAATSGYHRINFRMWANATDDVFAQVYRNGIAYGTNQSSATTTPASKSEDLFFVTGDLIQLYLTAAAGRTSYADNFQVLYDMGPVASSTLLAPQIILD